MAQPNIFDPNDMPPPPPQLRRQNAVVLVTVNGNPYPIQYGENGSEYITINDVNYNLNMDSNGRYIMMGDNVQPVTGGRTGSRRPQTFQVQTLQEI